MSRDASMYVDDMIDVCHRVLRYTEGIDRAGFVAGTMMHDAVLRNLEILGEAAKQVPESVRVLAPAIAWRRISGLRDILAHAYFGMTQATGWHRGFAPWWTRLLRPAARTWLLSWRTRRRPTKRYSTRSSPAGRPCCDEVAIWGSWHRPGSPTMRPAESVTGCASTRPRRRRCWRPGLSRERVARGPLGSGRTATRCRSSRTRAGWNGQTGGLLSAFVSRRTFVQAGTPGSSGTATRRVGSDAGRTVPGTRPTAPGLSPEGLAHYVEAHAVCLPDEFLEAMSASGWRVPEASSGVTGMPTAAFWVEWVSALGQVPASFGACLQIGRDIQRLLQDATADQLSGLEADLALRLKRVLRMGGLLASLADDIMPDPAEAQVAVDDAQAALERLRELVPSPREAGAAASMRPPGESGQSAAGPGIGH